MAPERRTDVPDDVRALIRDGYAAWSADDLDGYLAVFHPAVEFRTSGAFPGFDPVYRGRDGMARFQADMKEAWTEFEALPRSVEVAGDAVLVEVWFTAHGRESGIEVEMPFQHVLWFADGLAVRMAAARTRAEALALVAAGPP
jgi:ketosteroid isomerase-like protein